MTSAPLLQLIVSWGVVLTLLLIFIVIAFGTTLSIFGKVKFEDPAQQKALFNGLILVLVGGVLSAGVAYFQGALQLDTKKAATEVIRLGNFEYWKQHKYAGVHEIVKPQAFPSEYFYIDGDVRGKFIYNSDENVYVESNQRPGAPTWYFYFRPITSDTQSLFVYDDIRNYMLKLPISGGVVYLSTNGGAGPFGAWLKVSLSP